MAEWWDWSDDTAARDRAAWMAKTRSDYDRAQAAYDAQVDRLRAEGHSGLPHFRALHPQERMEILRDMQVDYPNLPARSQWAGKMAEEVIRYPMEIGTRPRDTAIRAAQELSAGNYGAGLGYATAVIPSVAVPALAAGRDGDSDDWRTRAMELGVSPGNVLLLDIATDPLTYVGPGVLTKGVSTPVRGLARGVRAFPQRLDELRYGRGARTELVDPLGNRIRRLRNTPVNVLSTPAAP